MGAIRPLEQRDLPDVSRLVQEQFKNPLLHEGFLARTFLDDPWCDLATPSLVAQDAEGQVVGFIAVQPRRLRLDDRPLRGVCCSHLVVAPSSRAGAVGAMLLRQVLAGPQDLTWSINANELVVRIWRLVGGQADPARSYGWMLVLRPVRWLASVGLSLVRWRAVGDELAPAGALPLPGSTAGRAERSQETDLVSEQADAAGIVDHARALAGRGQIVPDFDLAHLQHLFDTIRRAGTPLALRLVRRGDRPIGWYAYVEVASRLARLIHLQAARNEVGGVLGDAVAHARGSGQMAIGGRLEPGLEWPLERQGATLGFALSSVLHARDPDIRATLTGGSALLTQLTGEWWAIY
jgi:hypothetical protein